MSQIIRATFVSPSRHGMTWKVSGSGIATMSDSSVALKPVIDEPSKPIPSSSAPSTSPGVTAKLFRCPSMSLNHRRTNSTPSSCIRLSAFFRVPGSLVALAFDSTCEIGRHTSELQSRRDLVCRLLLEKKKKKINNRKDEKKKKKDKKRRIK